MFGAALYHSECRVCRPHAAAHVQLLLEAVMPGGRLQVCLNRRQSFRDAVCLTCTRWGNKKLNLKNASVFTQFTISFMNPCYAINK